MPDVLWGEGSVNRILEFEADVELYRVTDAGRRNLEISSKSAVSVDVENQTWQIRMLEPRAKFADKYHDFILEKPDYTGSEPWFIVSSDLNGYPIDLDQDQRIVWFVYCATRYLRARDKEPVPLPFGDARRDQYVHGCRINMRWRSDVDICPEQASFAFDRSLYDRGADEMTVEPAGDYANERDRSARFYRDNHTNGQVVVFFGISEWDSASTWGVPKSWWLDLNWYGKAAYRCNGRTTSVRTGNAISMADLPRQASITDKRVRDVGKRLNTVRYIATNAAIPSLDDPQVTRLLPKYRVPDNLLSTEHRREMGRTGRVFVLGLLVLTVCAPLVWFVRKFFSRS